MHQQPAGFCPAGFVALLVDVLDIGFDIDVVVGVMDWPPMTLCRTSLSMNWILTDLDSYNFRRFSSSLRRFFASFSRRRRSRRCWRSASCLTQMRNASIFADQRLECLRPSSLYNDIGYLNTLSFNLSPNYQLGKKAQFIKEKTGWPKIIHKMKTQERMWVSHNKIRFKKKFFLKTSI